MAELTLFVCEACGRSVEAWSDGNPYFVDESGNKQYAYHPDHEGLSRCIGNDMEHVCLSCGAEFCIDSRVPRDTCTKCDSPDHVPALELEGKPCPWCKTGRIAIDPDGGAIS